MPPKKDIDVEPYRDLVNYREPDQVPETGVQLADQVPSSETAESKVPEQPPPSRVKEEPSQQKQQGEQVQEESRERGRREDGEDTQRGGGEEFTRHIQEE